MKKVIPFLMFQDGKAEEVMDYYTSLIEESKITNIVRYVADEVEGEGKGMHATFTLKGQEFMCIDSNVKHEFTFTHAFSIYIICDTEKEIERLYKELSEDGQILMPIGDYGFS